MSGELVRSTGSVSVTAPRDISDVQNLGKLLAQSGYFADARETAQAAVKVMAGQELGIPPVAAMMGINIIKGKVALSGNLIASRIRAHGYDYKHIQFNEKGCVLRFLGKADSSGKREDLGESSFTEDDAKAAQLLASDMYKKYPRNMYFNRAISNGARWYCPEIFSGMPVYTAEELGAIVDAEGEIVPTTREQVPKDKLPQVPEDIKGRYKPTTNQPQNMSDEERTFRARMSDKYKSLDVFGELKSDCQALLGEEQGNAAYYSVLAHHGVEKSDQFATLGRARDCAWDLRQRIKAIGQLQTNKAKHVGEPTSPVTEDPDSWVPDNIGGSSK